MKICQVLETQLDIEFNIAIDTLVENKQTYSFTWRETMYTIHSTWSLVVFLFFSFHLIVVLV